MIATHGESRQPIEPERLTHGRKTESAEEAAYVVHLVCCSTAEVRVDSSRQLCSGQQIGRYAPIRAIRSKSVNSRGNGRCEPEQTVFRHVEPPYAGIDHYRRPDFFRPGKCFRSQ